VTAVAATYQQEFPGTKEIVAKAREWIAGLVAHLDTVRKGEIELCVSELATNAVLHTMSGAPDGTYAIRADITVSTVAITVTDMGPALIPRPRTSPEEHGRGLVLVAALADHFVHRDAETIAIFDIGGC
jgi:serine/threonine-protein kinase RsbW